MKNHQQIRCQRCRAVNPFGQELCEQCGTRLMLVVEPTGLRFEDDALVGSQTEAMLTERLSALEDVLTRTVNNLQRCTDIIGQQAQQLTRERLLLQSLIELLDGAGVVNADVLNQRWDAACNAQPNERGKLRQHIADTIIADYVGTERARFVELIKAAWDLIERRDVMRGYRVLEQAAALTPNNALLNVMLGQHFFQHDKLRLAHHYLERAHRDLPHDVGGKLLLAITCADLGDHDRAAALLIEVRQAGGADSFPVRYVYGRLLAVAGRWREALAEFKRAHAAQPGPETHYLVALAAYHAGYLKLAARHTDAALERDLNYAEARRLAALIRRKPGAAAQTRKRPAPAQTARVRPGRQGATHGAAVALLDSFFGATRVQRGRLLTGGDRRLAGLLRAAAIAYAAVTR